MTEPSLRNQLEAHEKAIAQAFAEPAVLKEWALKTADQIEALEKRLEQLEARFTDHMSHWMKTELERRR